MNDYSIGIIFIVLASLSWGVYGLLQKTLLNAMDSVQLTSLMYIGGTVLLLPFISPMTIFDLDALQLWALVFCSLNILVVYGAFTEALQVSGSCKGQRSNYTRTALHHTLWKIVVRYWPQTFPDRSSTCWHTLAQ